MCHWNRMRLEMNVLDALSCENISEDILPSFQDIEPQTLEKSCSAKISNILGYQDLKFQMFQVCEYSEKKKSSLYLRHFLCFMKPQSRLGTFLS